MDKSDNILGEEDLEFNTEEKFNRCETQNTGAFDLQQSEQELFSTLLKKKRDIIEFLTDNEVEIERKRMEIEEGYFSISGDEESVHERPQSAKSISTDVSIDYAFIGYEMTVDNEKPIFSAIAFKHDKSRKYCKTIFKLINKLKKDMILHNAKIDITFLMFLYNFLVANHIESAELEIFFGFCSGLIDVTLDINIAIL